MENTTALEELDRDWLRIAPQLLDYERRAWTHEDRDYISSTVRSQYLGRESINNSTVPQLIQIEGDRHFRAGIDKYAKILASARGSKPVYMYQFAYRGEFGASQAWSNSSVNRGKLLSPMRIYKQSKAHFINIAPLSSFF